MKKMKITLLSTLFIVLFTMNVNAHCKLEYPVGGESFKSGESITIKWKVTIAHNTDNWDLYFSNDNGATWQIIKEDINVNTLSYSWTVPELNTNSAKIKIVQDNQGTDYKAVSDAFTIKSNSAPTGNKIIIPGTITGTDINLTLQNGEFEFFPGHKTATMGVNGPVLGPTLIVNKGDFLDIKVKNDLNERTTIHWHGMHVSSENDGGPHMIIEPGDTWNPKYEVKNRASTCWYHPHLDTYTDEHVSKGIAGFIIVKDDEEAGFDLPRTYGVDDIPLAVQTRSFDDNYQVEWDVNTDDVLIVNGTQNAYVDVPAQVVRFRLLDGSSQRVFNFGLEGNKDFYMIATDGGLVEKPIKLSRLPLAPGERAEILVDFTGMEGKTISLMSYASEFPNGIYGASSPGPGQGMKLNGYNPNPMNGANFKIIDFVVGQKTANPVTSIPAVLAGETPYSVNDVDDNRNITFRSKSPGNNQLNGDFYINGVSFDMDIINITIPLNNTEIWTIQNNTPIAHPFHLHDVGYYILDIDGNPPPAYAKGKKDTYLVPGRHSTMRIITKFKNFANDSIPYMYHCHMLKHEDGGMMGSFVVVDNSSATNEINSSEGLLLYPNPARSMYITVELQDKKEKINAYSVIDESGRILSYHLVDKNEISNMYSVPVFNYEKGVYMVKIYTDDKVYSRKLVVE